MKSFTAKKNGVQLGTSDVGPKFERIRAGELSIDPKVQRKLTPGRSRKIAREFDPIKLGVFLVSRRSDGSLIVIDGQHRLAAINELAMSDLPVNCEVYEKLAIHEEASLFTGRNDSQKPSPFDRFDKGLIARDPQCVRINSTLANHQFKVTAGKTTNGVCAVNALIALDNYGGDILDRTIRIVRAAWPMDADAVEGNILRAVGLVLSKYPDAVDDNRMKERLQKTIGTPAYLLSQVKRRSNVGRSKAQIMGEEIIAAYNQRLSAKNKLGAL